MTDLIEHLMDATDDELRAEVIRRLDANHPRGTIVSLGHADDDGIAIVTIAIDMDDNIRWTLAVNASVKLVRVYEDSC